MGHWSNRDVSPDRVQHAGGDALPSGQAKDPDPTDPTQGLFWDRGAAPGSVSLHEVVLSHVLVVIRLFEDSVGLEGHMKHLEICPYTNIYSENPRSPL